MAFASVAVLVVSFVGGRLTSFQISNVAGISIALAVLIAMMLPIPAYWHEKGKMELRDAALTIPWGLFLMAFLPYTVAVAGRSCMGIALQDRYFVHLDQSLGVNVPGIMAWASHHWFGRFVDRTYSLLYPMLLVSFLLPALTGKVKHSQQFITANLTAFAVGLPLFALFPAVGPWYGYHLTANPVQAACQQSVLLLRTPGPCNTQLFSVVCFPSFHVIWAILCVNSLWCFKPLRIPAATLSGLIILSTVTTGWHYFVDLLSGFLVAAAAIAASRILSRWYTP
jgi:membrane-associated phospholipid phosphatase